MKTIYIAAAAAAAYLFLFRKPGCTNCKAKVTQGAAASALIESGQITNDYGGDLWQRMHGMDLMHPTYQNAMGGVSPDPGKVGLAQMFPGGSSLDWNGNMNQAVAALLQ